MKDGDSKQRFTTPSSAIFRPSPAAGADGWWGGLTAYVWRVLADPSAIGVLPTIDWIESNLRDSDDGEDRLSRFEGYLGIWTAVLDLLKYSFGWRSPAHGVARWVESGLPTDDFRLGVIHHLLGRHPREKAVNLAAYLFCQPGWSFTTYGHRGLSVTAGGGSSLAPPTIPDWVNEEYRVRAAGGDLRQPKIKQAEYLPFRFDQDSLHLSGHCWAPIIRTARMQGAPLRTAGHKGHDRVQFHRYSDGKYGNATLVLDNYWGWYDTLHSLGESLEPLESGRSWRVDVVCTPVGWLGTFRKSRQTGLWFSGPHSFHDWGEIR